MTTRFPYEINASRPYHFEGAMTPLEIMDYKKAWITKGFFQFNIHTDVRSLAKEWCKKRSFQWRYDYTEFTDNYQDTVRFELKEDSDAFNYWYMENMYG